MSDKKIYISPDGGKTIYEQIDGKRGPLVDQKSDDFDVPKWKYIRAEYEESIQQINRIIELHEMKYNKTREEFHKKAYESLISYMHELKAYIVKKEEDYFK